jgi:Arc/MetJ family transcription regulator
MLFLMLNGIRNYDMRTTVTIEDDLYQEALAVAEPDMDRSDLFREAVKVFIRVQAAKRLAALGGASPRMRDVPRRRAALKAR